MIQSINILNIIFKAWQVTDTCFFIKNMKRAVYLYEVQKPDQLQLPVFLPKIWSLACTWDLAGCKYLFSIKNIKPSMYLRPGCLQVPIFLFKIWSARYTCNRLLQVFVLAFLLVKFVLRGQQLQLSWAGHKYVFLFFRL